MGLVDRTNPTYVRFRALMSEVPLSPKAHREMLASQFFKDFAALYPVEKAQVETIAARPQSAGKPPPRR